MVKSAILFKLLYTSKLDICKVFDSLVGCLKGMGEPLYHFTRQVGPIFGNSGSHRVEMMTLHHV